MRIDDLAATLSLSRRTVERALHVAACAGQRVGTSCRNLDGETGEGASAAGMGAFWIVTMADWEAAMANVMERFRPLAAHRAGLERARPRVDAEPVREARRRLAAATGDGPAHQDRGGQGVLFEGMATGSRT